MTVHDPICSDDGNLHNALYGSFLPIPHDHLFPPVDVAASARHSLPGAVIVKDERIVINKGRRRIRLRVTNNGDRPIQVSCHFVFWTCHFVFCIVTPCPSVRTRSQQASRTLDKEKAPREVILLRYTL